MSNANDKNNSPKNFTEFFEIYFQRIYSKIISLSAFKKGIVYLLIFCASFLSARVGILGEGFQNLTYLIIPNKIFVTDKNLMISDTTSENDAPNNDNKNNTVPPESEIVKKRSNSEENRNKKTDAETATNSDNTTLNQPRIQLNFNFSVNGIQGILGKTYFSGDNVSLEIKTNLDCYITLFCLDKKGIHGLFNNQLKPSLIRGGDEGETITFQLDDTMGNEAYFAIASHTFFDFDSEIKPKLLKILSEVGDKGPDFTKWIDLDNHKFFQKSIYFKHK